MLKKIPHAFIFGFLLYFSNAAPVKALELPLIEQELDLSSPTAAVQTFASLHRAGDFESLWFVLDPALRASFSNAISQFRLEPFIAAGADGSRLMNKAVPFMAEHDKDLEKPGHPVDVFAIFAALMAISREERAEAFDLSGEMKQAEQSSRQHGSSLLQVLFYESPTAGRVAFELLQAPSKRWRVYSIGVNVGSGNELYWRGLER